MRNPSAPTRCSGDAVAAQRRATLPVFGGISGLDEDHMERYGEGLARSRAVVEEVFGNLRTPA